MSYIQAMIKKIMQQREALASQARTTKIGKSVRPTV